MFRHLRLGYERPVCHNHLEMTPVRSQLVKEAKDMVTLCFRNEPIEDVHAGSRPLPDLYR
jgi:hypothetical protein